MKRVKWIAIAGLITMFGFLTGCLGRSYTIGKDPSLEDITSVTVGGGGMELSSSWNYTAARSRDGGECTLYKRWWDEEENRVSEATVEISAYDMEKILQPLDGLKYVRYRAPRNVMDGYDESARIQWAGSPSGSWRIEFGETGMRDLLSALAETWDANAYKANEPMPVEGLIRFTFAFGPDDVADGEALYAAELDPDAGTVTLRYKESGMPEEDAHVRTCDASLLRDLESIVRENGADRWNGFLGNDSWVMDGSSFRLELETAAGGVLTARGRMRYPEGFRPFEKAVRALFLAAVAEEG